jgi:hypothetical protein
MVIEEFIATYADQEINRVKLLEAQKQMAMQQELAGGDSSGNRRGSNYAKNKSPRIGQNQGSPR